MVQLSTKFFLLKSVTERGKYARFSRLVKVQSILWCAWPPPGRSSTLKIVCGSNIDDIRGNTTLVANCLYF